LADAVEPSYVVWENVPGVLSTADNAFGCFLGKLAGEVVPLVPPGERWPNAGCVFGPRRKVAWRVLDAQYFGVPQRRRRVFVVACPRNGADPCEILFEREGVQRDSAPSREEGEETAGTTPIGLDEECNATVNGYGPLLRGGQGGSRQFVAVMAHGQAGAEITTGLAPTLSCNHEAPIAFHGRQDPVTSDVMLPLEAKGGQCVCFTQNDAARDATANLAPTLRSGNGGGAVNQCVAFTQNQTGDVLVGDVAPAMGTNSNATGRNTPKVHQGMQVRRLVPKECERLQGFPDNHTRIPWRNKPAEDCPDGPRYKALGNSMAVPCMRWIGERIQELSR
jgi:DNA (cytosine-5)-methyltransferase 1